MTKILYGFYKQYTQNGQKENDLIVLEKLISEINELISSTKVLEEPWKKVE